MGDAKSVDPKVPGPKIAYVVDDDPTFRRSLLLLLEAAGWAVQDFSCGEDFLAEVDQLRPGVLLLDLRMPGMSGLDLLEKGGARLLNFAIIILTGHGDVDAAVRALKGGAVDFLEKPFDGLQLLAMLDSNLAQLLNSLEFARREREAVARVGQLSNRERDVLSGLLAGAPHKAIARHLGISDRTVEMYRNNMVRKLGAKSTNEALHLGMLAKVQPAEVSGGSVQVTTGKSP